MTLPFEFLLAQLNKLYRKDPWVQAIYQGASGPLEDAMEHILELANSQYFDLLSPRLVEQYERVMGITPGAGQSMDDRKRYIEARWKGFGIVTRATLQAVAESWPSKSVYVDFLDGEIVIECVDFQGRRADLQSAIDEIKPAHLGIRYILTDPQAPTLYVGGHISSYNITTLPILEG